MKPAPEMPSDLDHQAKRKWEELVGSCDVDVDAEMLANYCRQHSSLMAIRREKKRQQRRGEFKTMVPARDGTKGLNPLVTENRLIASLNRMLKSLGLSPSREERGANRSLPSTPRPPGMRGDEPRWGWALEAALCEHHEPDAIELEKNRRRGVNEKLLARNDWRAYETGHDEGRPSRKDEPK